MYENIKQAITYLPETGTFVRVRDARRWKKGQLVGTVSNGYLGINCQGVREYGHRLAFVFMEDRLPSIVDHINGNKLDNRWCNLREVSSSQNAMNQSVRRDNQSGTPGVFYNVNHNGPNKWVAFISWEGRRIYLGRFNNEDEAVATRKIAEINYYGEHRRG